MDWESVINEKALAWLLPDAYARYRTPLLRALLLFLQGLPASRLKEIAAAQAALPAAASLSDRLVRLARSCPVLHKLGQTLARDRNLPAELRSGLQRLESFSPSVPMKTIAKVLHEELGPLSLLGVTLLPHALAEASVAVIAPFRFSNGVEGVFKVLKPGIEERMEVELGLLERVGSFLDCRCNELRLPRLDYRDKFERVREKLLNEVRFDIERHNLALARRFYRGDSRVVVPALFDFSTPRVTAMERVQGQKVTEAGGRVTKKEMARLVIEALIARPIFSREGRAVFHGDPHAGNLMGMQAGGLAVLDWSLAGFLAERERESMVQIILGGLGFSPERVIDGIQGLSMAPPGDPAALRVAAQKALGRIRSGRSPGFTWLKELLDDAVGNARLRFGVDLMLFRRVIQMVEGVVADLGGEADLIDRVFFSEFALHFSAEWPRRFFTSPDSRGFATRISNTDLVELAVNFPWRAAQF